jgi:hypothetical protein
MKLSLLSFQKEIPAAYIKEGKKLFSKKAVRELDEEPKGEFVAFVDEGADSFDVSITVGEKDVIQKHRCDCKSTYAFCKHKIAVLFELTQKEKQEKKKTPVKKVSATEQLLKAVDATALQDWVLALLQKNKDIEFSFTTFFANRGKQPTAEELKEKMEQSVKAVIKSRKKAELAEIKKITDIWTDINGPVISQCLENISAPQSILLLHTITETCMQYDALLKTGSNRIVKYAESVLTTMETALAAIVSEESWKETVIAFAKKIITVNNKAAVAYIDPVRLHYAYMLMNAAENSVTGRQLFTAHRLAEALKQKDFPDSTNGRKYKKEILALTVKHNLFSTYYALFAPVTFENEYNINLITALIDIKKYRDAETFCKKQVAGNYKAEYNVPYWELLKRIYSEENDTTKLVAILQQQLPFTFSYSDFLVIYNAMTDEVEKEKWKTKFFAKAKNNSNYGRDFKGIEFCFEMLDAEKKYKKMTGLLSLYTPAKLSARFFMPMFNTDKGVLLYQLLQFKIINLYSSAQTIYNAPEYIEEVIRLIQTNYKEAEIITALRKETNNSYHSYYDRPVLLFLLKEYKIIH